MEKKKKKISRVITIKLFIAVFIAFIVSSAVTYALLYISCEKQAKDLLNFNSESLFFDLTTEVDASMYSKDTNYYLGIYRSFIEQGTEIYLYEDENVCFTHDDGTVFLAGNKSLEGKNIRDVKYVGYMINLPPSARSRKNICLQVRYSAGAVAIQCQVLAAQARTTAVTVIISA